MVAAGHRPAAFIFAYKMSAENGNGVAAVLPSRSAERPMTILTRTQRQMIVLASQPRDGL
jgi:hypothetical protein